MHCSDRGCTPELKIPDNFSPLCRPTSMLLIQKKINLPNQGSLHTLHAGEACVCELSLLAPELKMPDYFSSNESDRSYKTRLRSY